MLPDDRLIGQFCDMTVHARLDRSFSETAVSHSDSLPDPECREGA